MISVRERLERREEAWLAPTATRSRDAVRQRAEDPDALRTAVQRDRDRIIHSKAFRRLKYKTQVFLSPTGDHMRTRLTHTLEVTQIARTIARALDLNEDLTEAIALGHDLGHTPFGHAGERALARVYPGFRHNEQSLRVVDRLERDGLGLNLTDATRDGILRHSKPPRDIAGVVAGMPATPEAQVVKIADGIAYVNHDFDDAVRGGMLRAAQLPVVVAERLGTTHSQRVNTLVTDVVEQSHERLGSPKADGEVVSMSPPVLEAANELRDFLFNAVYGPINAQPMTQQAERVVTALFDHYVRFPHALPSDAAPVVTGESLERRAVDVVCGMTDRYALQSYDTLFVRVPRAEEQ